MQRCMFDHVRIPMQQTMLGALSDDKTVLNTFLGCPVQQALYCCCRITIGDFNYYLKTKTYCPFCCANSSAHDDDYCCPCVMPIGGWR